MLFEKVELVESPSLLSTIIAGIVTIISAVC